MPSNCLAKDSCPFLLHTPTVRITIIIKLLSNCTYRILTITPPSASHHSITPFMVSQFHTITLLFCRFVALARGSASGRLFRLSRESQKRGRLEFRRRCALPCLTLVTPSISHRISSSFCCSSASWLQIVYVRLSPFGRIEADSSLAVFVTIAEYVHTLQTSPIGNRQIPIRFGRLEPVPNFT